MSAGNAAQVPLPDSLLRTWPSSGAKKAGFSLNRLLHTRAGMIGKKKHISVPSMAYSPPALSTEPNTQGTCPRPKDSIPSAAKGPQVLTDLLIVSTSHRQGTLLKAHLKMTSVQIKLLLLYLSKNSTFDINVAIRCAF